jgi:hypothetical protein
MPALRRVCSNDWLRFPIRVGNANRCAILTGSSTKPIAGVLLTLGMRSTFRREYHYLLLNVKPGSLELSPTSLKLN